MTTTEVPGGEAPVGSTVLASFGRLLDGVGFAAKEQLFGVLPGPLRPVSRQAAALGVLLVPGFGCGDQALTVARTWLRGRGHRPAGARIGLNLGCTTELVDRVERRAEEHAERTGGRVVLVGHSRGGWLSRVVATRRPDIVMGLVTAGSPVLDPLGANRKVIGTARFLTRLSAIGLPGLLDDDCFTGSCYRDNLTALAAPLPDGVSALAVYSRLDRVAPWQLCQDPAAECVEIESGHGGMLLHPDFYRAMEPRLAEWARESANAG